MLAATKLIDHVREPRIPLVLVLRTREQWLQEEEQLPEAQLPTGVRQSESKPTEANQGGTVRARAKDEQLARSLFVSMRAFVRQ